MSAPTPAHFGPYTILKEIARGGMAEVSLAQQATAVGLSRAVVLKRTLPQLAGDVEFSTMFVDEARLMMSFSHPHIAQVFDAGLLEGRHFIAMEYVPGATLSALLSASRRAPEPIPYEVAFGLALALAEALDYVHQRCDEYGNWLSIIHRDLKPSNVLVRADGVVKLIDFGIAQAASKRHHTRTGTVKGTVGYLAPEQILGEQVDQRADVFSLGLLLYQIFLGRYPFPGKSDAQRLRRLMSGDALSPQACRPDCPPALSALLSRALAPRPSERPFMGQLISELVSCARQMGLCPHLQVISAWARLYIDHEPEGSPELLMGPAIESLKGRFQVSAGAAPEAPEAPELAKTSVLSLPPRSEGAEGARPREVIEAKIDDLHPLMGGDTLFDASIQMAWEEAEPAPSTPPELSELLRPSDEALSYTRALSHARRARQLRPSWGAGPVMRGALTAVLLALALVLAYLLGRR
jgi:serine/threonine protein kinase